MWKIAGLRGQRNDTTNFVRECVEMKEGTDQQSTLLPMSCFHATRPARDGWGVPVTLLRREECRVAWEKAIHQLYLSADFSLYIGRTRVRATALVHPSRYPERPSMSPACGFLVDLAPSGWPDGLTQAFQSSCPSGPRSARSFRDEFPRADHPACPCTNEQFGINILTWTEAEM